MFTSKNVRLHQSYHFILKRTLEWLQLEIIAEKFLLLHSKFDHDQAKRQNTLPQRRSDLHQVIHEMSQELINQMSFKSDSRNMANLILSIHLV